MVEKDSQTDVPNDEAIESSFGNGESIEFNGEMLDHTEDMTPEMLEQVDMINDILKTEIIDTTTALNILINVASSMYNNEALNDLDRTLISKAFDSIQNNIEKGEDFYIKVELED